MGLRYASPMFCKEEKTFWLEVASVLHAIFAMRCAKLLFGWTGKAAREKRDRQTGWERERIRNNKMGRTPQGQRITALTRARIRIWPKFWGFSWPRSKKLLVCSGWMANEWFGECLKPQHIHDHMPQHRLDKGYANFGSWPRQIHSRECDPES